MTFEQRISQCLESAGIRFEIDDDVVLVPSGVGAEEVFRVLEEAGGFYHYPTVAELQE